jgi:protein TonB
MSGAVQADPAARRRRRDHGAWRLWLGWAAAAVLHGGLLAALLVSWPARLNPAPPNASAISLLILPANRIVSPASGQVAVRPKPAAEKAVLPPAAPVEIANTQIVRKLAPSPPARPAMAAPQHPAAAPGGIVTSRTVRQQVGDGFVAAQPAAGSANQPPEYPLQAQQHGEQGDVLLSIHVLPDGTADSVSVTQSSGYAILDAAAAKAVWKWRFQPSTLSGQPVPSVIPYRIHFSLQNLPQ